MIENLVTFVTLMLMKDFPGETIETDEVWGFAGYLHGAGYTPAQLNEDHNLFWRLDNTYRAYAHPKPFGS